jgi:hypothetical protein
MRLDSSQKEKLESSGVSSQRNDFIRELFVDERCMKIFANDYELDFVGNTI